MFIDGAGLQPLSKATRVRLANGKINVTDGPFSEAKEVVGGYSLIEAGSHAEAVALATRFMELHRIHWPEFEGEADFTVAGGQLKQLIGQTLFAAAKESTRYAFNGVLVNAKAKKLNLVSTDGRRLAQARGELVTDKTSKEGVKAIIPAKALQLVDKLIDDPEEAVSFKIN